MRNTTLFLITKRCTFDSLNSRWGWPPTLKTNLALRVFLPIIYPAVTSDLKLGRQASLRVASTASDPSPRCGSTAVPSGRSTRATPMAAAARRAHQHPLFSSRLRFRASTAFPRIPSLSPQARRSQVPHAAWCQDHPSTPVRTVPPSLSDCRSDSAPPGAPRSRRCCTREWKTPRGGGACGASPCRVNNWSVKVRASPCANNANTPEPRTVPSAGDTAEGRSNGWPFPEFHSLPQKRSRGLIYISRCLLPVTHHSLVPDPRRSCPCMTPTR